ncbi:MAG: hypothetical protein JW833_13410 [Prolixibacteraceae bacterium]|nr:hypothetical protein [Prolixibacteraceae bacterium]
MDRRSFISKTTLGVGSVTFCSLTAPFINSLNANSKTQSAKKLIATTDYTDNIGTNYSGSRYGAASPRLKEYHDNFGCFMNKKQLDEMHQVLASLGVTRHQWIVDTYWSLYENYPHGFNLLEEAVKSAHKYGIEFIAEIKPFEGGGFSTILPHSMPVPDGVATKDLRGVFPLVRPFIAQNPHLCLKCKPGKYEYQSPLRNIRLIKSNDRPTQIKADHLTIFTSATNNKFSPYSGTATFRESVEMKFVFPRWEKCRVIHLEGLQIPDSHKYILIKCTSPKESANFSNEKGSILEFEGADGNIIPHYLGEGPVKLESHLNGIYNSYILSKILRYLKNQEVIDEIGDIKKMQEHYRDFYAFETYKLTDKKTLDEDGYIVAALGKPEYLLGNLHPIYKEVREFLLELTRFCLDSGVDGINYRVANHSKLPDKWDYGFNDEVIKAAEGKTDQTTINRINGDAYTQFLFEARDLIKGRGKKMIHHLHGSMLVPDDRGRISALPPNFEWQWEKWVNEIADEFEFRGAFMLRPWHLDQVLDTFSTVTTQAKKSFYYQGDFHRMSFEGPFKVTEEECKLVNKHPGLDGLVLYETANYTRIDENGNVVGSPEHAEIIKKHFFSKQNK